ncbi:hypothetical protein DL93DRAFT_2212896 [Clavulina sp. PMI_390]|nr:hypothetical protein DL93DRAFT_2212896 [Clavulina sp. PMI_390]
MAARSPSSSSPTPPTVTGPTGRAAMSPLASANISTIPSTATSYFFLGIELATDQLRAALVDEHLATVGVEVFDFEGELPDYQLSVVHRATRGGVLTKQNSNEQIIPVELWIRGLDRLFERLAARFDLSRVRSIGGCALSSTVWWKHGSSAQLANLSSTLPLHQQLSPSALSLLHIPLPTETSTQSQALTLESALGAPGPGTAAHLPLAPSQIARVREAHRDAYEATDRIQLASAFIASLLLGRWAPATEAEMVGTGLWDHSKAWWDELMLQLLAGGSVEESVRLRGMLGEVERVGSKVLGGVAPYFVDRYGISRDAFVIPFTSEHLSSYLSVLPSPSELVLSFGQTDVALTPAKRYRPSRLYNLYPHPAQSSHEKPRYIAGLLSRNADQPRELVRDLYTKSWSAFDRLVSVIPPGGSIGLDDKLFSFWVLQGESFPFALVKGVFRFETGVKVTEFRDLRANPRSLIESQVLSFRVRYARMIHSGVLPRSRTASPSRGTQPTSASPSGPNTPTGTGPPSNTFLASPSSSRPSQHAQNQQNQRSRTVAASLGLSFDPYDPTPLPKRLIVLGSAANFPSVVHMLGDVFNAPVYVPLSDAGVANAGPKARAAPVSMGGATGSMPNAGGQSASPTHTGGAVPTPASATTSVPPSSSTKPAAPSLQNPSTAVTMSAATLAAAQAAHLPPGVVPAPSRASAALGGAYLALWAWRRRTRPDERFESFEEEMRGVMRAGAEALRMERKATGTGGGYGYGSAYGIGLGSGRTTPLARSVLGIPSPRMGGVGVGEGEEGESEEDDDHVLVPQQQQQARPPSAGSSGPGMPVGGDIMRGMTPLTSMTASSSTSSLTSMGMSSSTSGMPPPGMSMSSSGFLTNSTSNTTALSSASGPYPSISPSSSTPNLGLMAPHPSSANPLSPLQQGYQPRNPVEAAMPAFGLSNNAAASSPSSTGPPGTAASAPAPATLSVSPLPTDEADIDLGLVKVSECDLDAFMMYAALVPEYCRLEGMLVRALV